MLRTTTRPALTCIEPIDPVLLRGDRIQPGHPLFGLVWINPERVSGTPCFYGTRVPLKNLFDSLAAGETLDDFLDGFDGVTREQAMAALVLAGDDLLSDLEAPLKVLLDHNVDRRLRRHLPGHEVRTTREMGWERLSNGQLLRAAADTGFEAFVSIDKKL